MTPYTLSPSVPKYHIPHLKHNTNSVIGFLSLIGELDLTVFSGTFVAAGLILVGRRLYLAQFDPPPVAVEIAMGHLTQGEGSEQVTIVNCKICTRLSIVA